MRKKRLWILLSVLISLLACIGCTKSYNIVQDEQYRLPGLQTSKYKTVAIMDFANLNVSEKIKDRWYGGIEELGGSGDPVMYETFNMAFAKKGFKVLERDKILKVVQEQMLMDKNFSSLSDIEKARRVGRVLGVDIIFFGNPIFDDHFYQYKPSGGAKSAYYILYIIGAGLAVGSQFVAPSSASAAQIMGYSGLGTLISGGITQGIIYKRNKNDSIDANSSGIAKVRTGSTVFAYHYMGTTMRAVEVSTGSIVWVASKRMAIREKMKRNFNLEYSNSAKPLAMLADSMVDDFIGGSRDKGVSQ